MLVVLGDPFIIAPLVFQTIIELDLHVCLILFVQHIFGMEFALIHALILHTMEQIHANYALITALLVLPQAFVQVANQILISI